MKKTFRYVQHHLPSGKRHELAGEFESENDFLRHMNQWNRSGNDDYLYYSAEPITPVGAHTVVKNSTKRLADKSQLDMNRLEQTGIWSRNGVAAPHSTAELEKLIGDDSSVGC